MTKVAVVIPTHPERLLNGKLCEALASVRAQTRPADEVFVAIDYDREGAAATRQRALMLVDPARFEFVAFLDSDDMFMPRHLELLLAHQQQTGCDMNYSWYKVRQEFADGQARILEDDPVFPVTHFLNEFDPENPIETTITTMCRTTLAQQVGFHALDRGEINSGEDRAFVLGLIKLGANIKHLRRKTWIWNHWWIEDGMPGNTSGLPTRGDAIVRR